jgi:hypothetical protein
METLLGSIMSIKTPIAAKSYKVVTTEKKGLKNNDSYRNSNSFSEPADVIGPSPKAAKKESRIPKILKSSLKKTDVSSNISTLNKPKICVVIDENKNLEYNLEDTNKTQTEYDAISTPRSTRSNVNRLKHAGFTPSNQYPINLDADSSPIVSNVNVNVIESDKKKTLNDTMDPINALSQLIEENDSSPSNDSSRHIVASRNTPNTVLNRSQVSQTPQPSNSTHKKMSTPYPIASQLNMRQDSEGHTRNSHKEHSTSRPNNEMNQHNDNMDAVPLRREVKAVTKSPPLELSSSKVLILTNKVISDSALNATNSVQAEVFTTMESMNDIKSIPLENIRMSSPKLDDDKMLQPVTDVKSSRIGSPSVHKSPGPPSALASRGGKTYAGVFDITNNEPIERNVDVSVSHPHSTGGHVYGSYEIDEPSTHYDDLVSSIQLNTTYSPTIQAENRVSCARHNITTSDSLNYNKTNQTPLDSVSNDVKSTAVKIDQPSLLQGNVFAYKRNAFQDIPFPNIHRRSETPKILEVQSSPHSGLGDQPGNTYYPDLVENIPFGQNNLFIEGENGGVSLYRPTLVRGAISVKIGDRLKNPEDSMPHMMIGASIGTTERESGNVDSGGCESSVDAVIFPLDGPDEYNGNNVSSITENSQENEIELTNDENDHKVTCKETQFTGNCEETPLHRDVCIQCPSVNASFDGCGLLCNSKSDVVNINEAVWKAAADLADESLLVNNNMLVDIVASDHALQGEEQGYLDDDSNAGDGVALNELIGTPRLVNSEMGKNIEKSSEGKYSFKRFQNDGCSTNQVKKATPLNSSIGKPMRVPAGVDQASESDASFTSDISSSVLFDMGYSPSRKPALDQHASRKDIIADNKLEFTNYFGEDMLSVDASEDKYDISTPLGRNKQSTHPIEDIRSQSPIANNTQSIKEIIIEGQVNNVTSININLKNKKSVPINMSVSVILVRFDEFRNNPKEYAATPVDVMNTLTKYNKFISMSSSPIPEEKNEVFKISPKEFKIAARSDSSIHLQFHPRRCGVYSAVIKTKSKHKVNSSMCNCLCIYIVFNIESYNAGARGIKTGR